MKKLYSNDEIDRKEGEATTYYTRFDGQEALVARITGGSLGGVQDVYGSKNIGVKDYSKTYQSYWNTPNRNIKPSYQYYVGDLGDYVVRYFGWIRTFKPEDFHEQFVKNLSDLDNVKQIKQNRGIEND